LMTATVIASTTVEAEVYAKVVFLLGAEAGLQFVDEQPSLAACVITANGEALISDSFQEYHDVLFTYSSSPSI
ncbi:MAG TPA: hypothetical protein VFF59_06620, partial [Anaerolineae bacterium]|nr:hypothetical protein [Anaerolineae bacterium]